MFICLSSGERPRYRQDVLRSLAMPKGSQLQFRYDLRWIDSPIQSVILSGGYVRGEPCLIAYIDQRSNTETPVLIPCRYATIVEANAHGSTASLVLALQEYAYAKDLTAFNNEMRTASAAKLPTWGPDGKIAGAYCFKIDEEPATVTKSLDLSEWEKIVEQIASRPDFEDENCFYTIEGIVPVGLEETVAMRDGVYELKPNQEYELRIYHFHPQKTANATIQLNKSSTWLTFTTTPSVIMDSRYDFKRVRMITGKPNTQERAILTIVRNGLEFDLPLLIRRTWLLTLGYGIILGVLLAGPQIVAALANPNLPLRNVVAISFVSGILGLGAGILAAFGLKKQI
jgi:hypothetical protein